MDRYWLLTWTTYGTWLPGDSRGFVSNVSGNDGKGTRHNVPGTPCDADQDALQRYMRQRLRGDPIYLVAEQAEALLAQVQETAAFRGWQLLAVAVMANHLHLLVGVNGDPAPDVLLRDFKSYGSRRLNERWGKPLSGTWWTESGSRRKLTGERAVLAALRYVREQPHALVIWVNEALASGGRQPPVETHEETGG